MAKKKKHHKPPKWHGTDWQKMTLREIKGDVCRMLLRFGWQVRVKKSKTSESWYYSVRLGFRSLRIRVSDHPANRYMGVDLSIGHKGGATRKQFADLLIHGKKPKRKGNYLAKYQKNRMEW